MKLVPVEGSPENSDITFPELPDFSKVGTPAHPVNLDSSETKSVKPKHHRKWNNMSCSSSAVIPDTEGVGPSTGSKSSLRVGIYKRYWSDGRTSPGTKVFKLLLVWKNALHVGMQGATRHQWFGKSVVSWEKIIQKTTHHLAHPRMADGKIPFLMEMMNLTCQPRGP